MPAGEFDLIDRYFRRLLPERDDVLVGIGDDGAVLELPRGRTLIPSISTLSTNAWNACGGDPARLGHDAMSAPLASLAAAGAEPAWATLALTLSEIDEVWLAAFSEALFAVAKPLSVALIGGDTTRGPFAVTVVAHGLTDTGGDAAPAGNRAGTSPGE
jgi:thiamine-monophosphate kinase